MSIKVIAVLTLIGIVLFGFIKLIIGLHRLTEKHKLITEFTKRLIKMANIYFSDNKISDGDYEWLLANVDEVNNMLGVVGNISYKPAYANYMHNNYQILINTLPQFKTRLGVEHDDISFIESLLKRFAGVLNKTIQGQRSDLKNPIKWFSEGVSFLLSLPLAFLESIGVLNTSNYSRAKSSRLFKALVGIVSVVSFIDALYAIITGNSFTVQIIQSLILKF
jgi:hypothetical protein